MQNTFAKPYHPSYFLAALGAGGLSVSFFMYLMFLVPHPESPIPTFSDLSRVYQGTDRTLQIVATLALIGIAYFATVHVRLLLRNAGAYQQFKGTAAYDQLRSSNAEVTLQSAPLTYAMTINVAFIVGALAVPGLWDVVEYLFPAALLAFAAVGFVSARMFLRYIARVSATGGFNADDTNHFVQLTPSFTFAMIAVGFAAPAAMSHVAITSTLGAVASIVFLTASLVWLALIAPMSFRSILSNGLASPASPTLWIGVPVATLVGITLFRLGSGMSHTITGHELPPAIGMTLLGTLFGLQVALLAAGYAIMRSNNYFSGAYAADTSAPGAYGLICPGVAFAVLSMFFIHRGLIATGILERASIAHVVLLAGVGVVQVITIATLLKLNRALMNPNSNESARHATIRATAGAAAS